MIFGTLIVTFPDGPTQLVSLDIKGVRIGSAPDNDLVIRGPGVLPYHAMISCERHDMPVMYLSSAALPHRTRTAASLPQALCSGAIVPIGQYRVTYQAGSQSANGAVAHAQRQPDVEFDLRWPPLNLGAVKMAPPPPTMAPEPITAPTPPLLQRWLARSARPKPRMLSPLIGYGAR